jgi:hypothetical protein
LVRLIVHSVERIFLKKITIFNIVLIGLPRPQLYFRYAIFITPLLVFLLSVQSLHIISDGSIRAFGV